MTGTSPMHPTANSVGESVKGKMTEAKGEIEETGGTLTGSAKTHPRGKVDQADGKTEDAMDQDAGDSEDASGKAERAADE